MFCLTAKLTKKSLQDQSSYRLEKTGLTYFDQEGEKVLGFPVDQFEDIGRRRPRNQGIRQVLRVSGCKTNIRKSMVIVAVAEARMFWVGITGSAA